MPGHCKLLLEMWPPLWFSFLHPNKQWKEANLDWELAVKKWHIFLFSISKKAREKDKTLRIFHRIESRLEQALPFHSGQGAEISTRREACLLIPPDQKGWTQLIVQTSGIWAKRQVGRADFAEKASVPTL